MSRCTAVARPLARQWQLQQQTSTLRCFSTSQTLRTPEAASTDASPATPGPLDLDPSTVSPQFEQQLMRSGKLPVGSRRRRAALRTSPNVPFEQLPYQAFQEARKILAADREQKLASLKTTIEKMSALRVQEPADAKAKDLQANQLKSLQKYADKLVIMADINDPLVKMRSEDGTGDMNKPIYRYVAEKKWRGYDHRLISQRISQFNIVPDILPKLEPAAEVQLYFRKKKVQPGDYVDSLISENCPRLRVQVFDKGERKVSVVIIDADVPDLENNTFTKRCHYVAANIPLDPTTTSVPLSSIKAEDQLAVPWEAPVSQKGAPYHRLAVFVLGQKPGETVDVAKLKELYAGRENFSLKSMRDKFGLSPVGFTMFRTIWDENTAGVMERLGVEGGDKELRPTRVYSLRQPIRARGWEAKRQGPKYRHLWKYTKRIKGVSNSKGWIKRR